MRAYVAPVVMPSHHVATVVRRAGEFPVTYRPGWVRAGWRYRCGNRRRLPREPLLARWGVLAFRGGRWGTYTHWVLGPIGSTVWARQRITLRGRSVTVMAGRGIAFHPAPPREWQRNAIYTALRRQGRDVVSLTPPPLRWERQVGVWYGESD